MRNKTFYMLSLGCDKNTVDSDSMSRLLVRSGYLPAAGPGRANIIIVNTCGFIQAARNESYDALIKLSKRKRTGQLLIAAGCLTQRYGDEVCGVFSASMQFWERDDGWMLLTFSKVWTILNCRNRTVGFPVPTPLVQTSLVFNAFPCRVPVRI